MSSVTLNTALAGLHNASNRVANNAEKIAKSGAGEFGLSDAELTTALVDNISAKTEFKANAAVIRTEKEMQDQLLNILA